MLIDVDHFKKFNDSYGHQAGDIVLKSVSKEIIKRIRKSDIAARFGGDEFAIVLPETAKEDAKVVGESISKAIREHTIECDCIRGNEDLSITLSIGIAELKRDKTELIEDADKALYKVKELGRNCVVVWE
jgi:diguanylate cyclase (GGDEF)-like protein